MKEQLYAIRNTLNQIEVRGSGNLDKLLGCIQAIEGLIQSEQEAEHAEDHAE